MKKIIFVILGIFWVFFSLHISYGYDIDEFSTAVYSWSNWYIKNNTFNKQNLVKNFCDNINKYDKNNNAYNSKDSLFLSILCTKLWIQTSYKSNAIIQLKEDHLKNYKNLVESAKNDKSLWIYRKCNINWWYIADSSSLNNVDFSCVSSSAFNELANDYLNIATYIVYWWFKWNDWMKRFEKDFFLWAVCEDSYLNWNDDNKKRCKHTKTKKYFKDLVEWLNNWIKNLYFLKVTPSDIYDVISWKNWIGHLLNVKDKLYNELYFYSIFSEYYASMIELEHTILSVKSDNSNWYKQVQFVYQKEVQQARKNILLARYSIKRSFAVLKDVYWTLPLHIWYMALKEDILKLMESLAKIYTPIDQLRTKLKNVQDKDKK